MHPVAQSVIENIDTSVYEGVARAAIGDPSATLIGKPAWSEISTPHNDLRTIAILKIEGRAMGSSGESTWSSVQKLIDTSVDGGTAVVGGWVDPAREEAVYENALFSGNGLRFRPARCYLVGRPMPNLKMFWLEDLTEADGTPFSVSQLTTIARDIGEFNGFHFATAPRFPVEPAVDSYMVRWKGFGYEGRLNRAEEVWDQPEVRRTFGDVTMQTARQLFELLDRLAARSKGLGHSLSFGDCNPGNLFLLDNSTVAIDWASVTMDPTGVDAGCLIGASMLWGKHGAGVAEVERELFSAYVEGLDSADWTGEVEDVRRAFFGQFGCYLIGACVVPTYVSSGTPERVAHMRDFAEKRFQTPYEEIPELLSPVVARYPAYIEEITQLLA